VDRPWKIVSSERRARFEIFSVRADRSVSPDTGFEKEWTILETPDWVNVIPRTPEGKIVLIRQYRPGTGRHTVEIPGGAVDPEDGDPMEAARRELLEETGYRAVRLVHIGTVEPNPAFQTNRCHTYLAEGAVRIAEQDPDPGEEIEVLEAGEAEVRRMLADGTITHALVVAAFFWHALRGGAAPCVDASPAEE
jgi:8-oxo-dGTP pyrophosphatase MutT (NUDIX family)